MTDRLAEQRLIKALIARDRGAWCRFVEQFQGLVYARVVRTANELHRRLDCAESEDICADVFASLVANDYADLRRFEGRSSLTTWLSVIARRISVRALTRDASRTRLAPSNQLDEEFVDPEPAWDSLDQLIQAEDTDRLMSTLRELNDADQFILRSFYLDGMTYLEISQRMEISTNTVGPKLHRALHRLRQLLEPEDSPEARTTRGARTAT